MAREHRQNQANPVSPDPWPSCAVEGYCSESALSLVSQTSSSDICCRPRTAHSAERQDLGRLEQGDERPGPHVGRGGLEGRDRIE
eukprot:5717954-Prymnesium_polylepis.1